VLLEETADVLTFRLERAVVALLAEHASSLYDWRQPELPEDLCLLREDGDAALVTIAHEHDAYLILSPAELDRLEAEIPQVAATLIEDE